MYILSAVASIKCYGCMAVDGDVTDSVKFVQKAHAFLQNCKMNGTHFDSSNHNEETDQEDMKCLTTTFKGIKAILL